PQDELRSIIAELDRADAGTGANWDRYGDGGPVAALETRVAELLGKPAAVMFPSGTMAQQSVLRVWSDRIGSRRIAIPALSHLLNHEQDGPRLLNAFEWAPLTSGVTTGGVVPTVDHLAAIPGVLGAALLELPLRDGGYLLPSWEELEAFSRACSDRGVPLHLDGARIWESAPHLGHSTAEIAALADTVYVSFYKGLRGLAGAVVAGPEDVIAEARLWRSRHGGTLWTMMPYAVSALRGLREELPRMAEYHQRAVEMAELLAAKGIRTFPRQPHCNAFRIFVEAPGDVVTERVVSVMERERLAVTPPWGDSEDVPGWSWTEFTVGPATMDWSAEGAVEVLARVLLG
ncbi:MAG TPA: beta-eliminating lyase-related protein, partial [Dermatophilaceae bacterium]|nr:beta-eliminating lyase-related protein [Dermatophilaceae bacterium]